MAFPGIADQWQQIIVFVALASMALGSFAAIGQRNIKRLMAYSSIGHMGFAGQATGYHWSRMGLLPGAIEGEGIVEQACRCIAEDRPGIGQRMTQMRQDHARRQVCDEAFQRIADHERRTVTTDVESGRRPTQQALGRKL